MAKSRGRCDIGVDYFFYGTFAVTPPVSSALRDEINGFNPERTPRWGKLTHYPWEVSNDCDAICATDDGVRNAWDCDEDLALLVAKLTSLGHAITGEIEAEAEEDFWKYTVDDAGRVLLHRGYRDYDGGTPIKIGDTDANEAV